VERTHQGVCLHRCHQVDIENCRLTKNRHPGGGRDPYPERSIDQYARRSRVFLRHHRSHASAPRPRIVQPGYLHINCAWSQVIQWRARQIFRTALHNRQRPMYAITWLRRCVLLPPCKRLHPALHWHVLHDAPGYMPGKRPRCSGDCPSRRCSVLSRAPPYSAALPLRARLACICVRNLCNSQATSVENSKSNGGVVFRRRIAEVFVFLCS
jgi:hypothetical protein